MTIQNSEVAYTPFTFIRLHAVQAAYICVEPQNLERGVTFSATLYTANVRLSH